MEKGGKVPVGRLLNTFVSATRRDKHYRRERGELLGRKRRGRYDVFLLVKKKTRKMEGVFP